VLATPKPQIRYRNFEDSSIKLEVMANIDKPANRGKVVHELIKDISKGFMEEDITIPFPQRDIHIKPTTDKESVRSIK
jgi:MscS family membrane protein